MKMKTPLDVIKIGEAGPILQNRYSAKVSSSQWLGNEDSWVKNTHPFAFEINNKITEKKMMYMN